VAQLVKPLTLTFSSGYDLRVVRLSPILALRSVQSPREILSLCPSPPQINKQIFGNNECCCCEHLCAHVSVLPVDRPRSTLAGSDSNSVFDRVNDCQTVLHAGCVTFRPTSKSKSSSSSGHPVWLVFVFCILASLVVRTESVKKWNSTK